MGRVRRPQVQRYDIVAPFSWWERLAAWQPDQRKLVSQDRGLQPAHQEPPPQAHETCEERGARQEQRICQGQINACFIGIYAILGISLALVNAVPNQEGAEVETLGLLLILLLVPLGCNRAGAVVIASVYLTLLPTIALVATFTQPLPSGQSVLTWTYDAGLAFAGLGARSRLLPFVHGLHGV